MSCFLTSILLLGGLAMVFLWTMSAHVRTQRRSRIYQELAVRYRGTCSLPTWWGYPSVRFAYGETRVLVDSYSSRSPDGRSSQVQFTWPEESFFCELMPYRPGMESRYRYLRLTQQKVEVAGEEFSVVTNSEATCQTLFTEGVRWQLHVLQRQIGSDPLYLLISRGRMLIRANRLYKRFGELEEFTQASLDLFDQLSLARAAGIEFLHEGEAAILEDVRCPICGALINEDLVYCRRCKTPHHAECWDYCGTCSTYGCGEKVYRRP